MRCLRWSNPINLPPRAIERLLDMPPARQEQFFRNNQRFQSLPPEQQAQIRRRLDAWNRLTPDQQQALRDRQSVWEQMTPEQQRNVRQSLLPRWQQMPPARRQAILQRLHSLRNMSEADRRAKLNDPAFVEGLNSEDREMLGQLAHLHVGIAPDSPGACSQTLSQTTREQNRRKVPNSAASNSPDSPALLLRNNFADPFSGIAVLILVGIFRAYTTSSGF